MAWKVILTEKGLEKVKGAPGVNVSEKSVYPCMMPSIDYGVIELTIKEGLNTGVHIYLALDEVAYAYQDTSRQD